MGKNKSNVILIGICGCGKSTVGVLLAKAMGRYFLDTDVYIQAVEDNNLQDIIDDKGLERFCRIEESHIICVDLEDAVIATGGSVVYSKAAMKHLAEIGTIVHLDLPYKLIEERVRNLYKRGVVMGDAQTLEDLYKERQPLYEKYAEVTIDCSGKNHEAIVEEIIARVDDNVN